MMRYELKTFEYTVKALLSSRGAYLLFGVLEGEVIERERENLSERGAYF